MLFLKKFFKKNKKEKEIDFDENKLPKEGCGCKECENPKRGDFLKEIQIEIETIPCKPNPYFVAEEESAKFFKEFEIRLTTLNRLYLLNDTFLKEYYKQSRNSLKETKNDEKKFMKYSKCYFINGNAFKIIHNMSTLLNIFTIFEVLLKNIVKDMGYDEGKSLEEIQNRNSSYLTTYIYYLEKNLDNDFYLEENEKNFIGIVRKIRNDYLHENMSEIPESMEKELVKIFDLRLGKRIEVDQFFIIKTCEIFGKIAKRIEKDYWKYKESFLKNNK